MPEHKLIFVGFGPRLTARCSCERWAWLGTFEGAKGRVRKARIEHERHASRAENRPWRDP